MFSNRRDAGRALAVRLGAMSLSPDAIVVGLPRGGVPIAYEVATELGLDMDVVVVRKVGVPGQPELAMGAVGERGAVVVSQDIVDLAGVGPEELDAAVERALRDVESRTARLHRDPLSVRDREVIVVDDGVATGATVRAACEVLRAAGAKRIVVAMPVAAPDWTVRLTGVADECIAVETPRRFASVGAFYDDFDQVSDAEVVELMQAARTRPGC